MNNPLIEQMKKEYEAVFPIRQWEKDGVWLGWYQTNHKRPYIIASLVDGEFEEIASFSKNFRKRDIESFANHFAKIGRLREINDTTHN